MFFSTDLGKYKEDIFVILTILLCALLLRVPYFDFPPSTVADEGVFAFFITNVVHATPFFEPHPPLSWMVFRFLVPELEANSDYWPRRIGINTPFGNFPYKPLRLFDVFVGSCIPVVVYVLARLLGGSRYLSVVPAFLVVVDNALIIYSRSFLPETLLIFLGITGLCAVVAGNRFSNWFFASISFLLSGVLLGLSGSVKWTGFGFLAASIVYVFLYRGFRFIFLLILGALFAYSATFVIYFGTMQPGLVNASRSFYHTKAINEFTFPGKVPLFERLKSALDYTKIAFLTHAGDEGEIDRAVTNDEGGPWRWPLSMSVLIAWQPWLFPHFIVLFGNPVAWTLGFFSFVIVFADLVYLWYKKKYFSRLNFFLCVAYLGNYVPFFFISRKLFLYSYFPALLFSYLLVPVAFTVLWERFGGNKNFFPIEKIERIFFFSVLILTAITFLSVSPITYGF